MVKDITIQSLDPNTFEYQTYSDSDSQLIVQSQLDTVFSKDTDYIEYYVYDQNKNLIYPSTTIPLLEYDVRNGDVLLDPLSNLTDLGFDLGVYNILYTFYRKRLASNIGSKYFIANISSDRTEIRLDSNIITNDLIISSSNEFLQYRENADYFVDFYLNFGENQTVIANNIRLETEQGIDPTVLIKLYEPLPNNFSLKDELWIVEELSLPQAYEADFPFVPIIEDDFTFISGPNYNLNVIQETSTGGESFSFNTLLQSDLTSSINQIQNLLNQKEIDININYEKYSNFVHFSSAKIRLENFYYKVGLIESASNQLSQNFTVVSPTSNTPSYIESKAQITGQIDTIIKNFDGYESFLYFNSGSQYSYPKTTILPPYQLAPTGSTEVLTWIGNASVGETYYGGQALSASDYDQDNRNWLYWSIPEYLRDDPANEGYELFVDMVAQYYDNVWVYTKDISNKFDADNRLEYGIAKDLVADAIRDFGVKLYASNFNTNDLFTAFLGLTPSGSAFPFPNMTGSLPTESGFEYVDTQISASNDIVPLNNVQKQVYKRIYHNIPYLLKTKGTIAGIRALITSYGIPDTILRISEFGGKDRNESQDYDLKQDVFNYAFDTGVNATNFVSSSLKANTKFPVQLGTNKARTIQLRFKPSDIPLPTNNVANSNIRYSQSIFSTDDSGGNLILEYTGSGFVTGSYSGSIASPYDTYGTLKFVPAEGDNPNLSASVYLPFFNGDWWSIQMNVNDLSPSTSSLYVANEIDGKIGFNESSLVHGADNSYYFDASIGFLNKDTNIVFDDGTIYTPFSGSFQELRYYVNEISQSKFLDYTVNPYSNEGNGINSTPDEQFFRAALGTQLDTGSRTSIHPRVTGSAVQITQSFATDTSTFFTSSAKWVTNVEDIFQDQAPAGIKNRITDKIHKENLILAEAPYGFQTPTSSKATISSTTSDVLSSMESIQQQSFVSQSYTPNVNYLEVAFSPSNQINDDINAQLGYFNLGDYIGDPRFISSSDYSYPNLDRLRDAYFEKYIKGYDIVDFIRLIKFFDNSLFKMIKDFTPARTSLASGVVVKQHLLERNRQRPAQVTSSQHVYEGLVVNLPKDYSSGSSDFPQYSTEGSSLYKFSGGPGGSFNRYNGLQTSPSGSKGLGPDNRFNLTQSWTESFDYGSIDRSIINSTFFNQSSSQYISASYKGIRTGVIHSDQSEFYTGIFTGSYIEVSNGDLNPGCEPYLNVVDTPILFKPIFFTFADGLGSTVNENDFLNQENYPPSGYAWVASKQTIFDGDDAGTQQVTAIKLNQLDVNGVEIISYLNDFTSLRFLFLDATLPYNLKSTEYIIEGRTRFSEHSLLRVSQAFGQGGNNFPQIVDSVQYYPITSSTQGGSMNWSLEAKTDYSTILTQNSESSDNVQQNNLSNSNITTQEQNIFFWSGPNQDALGFFDNGGVSATTEKILDQEISFTSSAYTIPYTPNIPLVVSASILYSSSIGINSAGVGTDSGIYHSGSSYQGSNLAIQDFILDSGGRSVGGLFVDLLSPRASAFAASSLPVPDASDDTVFMPSTGLIQTNDTNFNIWEDQNLSILAGFDQQALPSNAKFYKFSNGSNNFVSQIILRVVNGISGNYFNVISNISSGKATAFEVPLTSTSTLFIPSPLYVLGLGDVAFNGNNWNTQIPGNSGSGANMGSPYAGHPKIKTAGTASMDWSFPSLTLEGTPPALNNTAVWVPFSGSALNVSNDDFFANFAPGSGLINGTFRFLESSGTPQMGFEYDGSVELRLSFIKQVIENDIGVTVNTINALNFRTSFSFTSTNVTNAGDYSVRAFLQTWDGTDLGSTKYYLFGENGLSCNSSGAITAANLASPSIAVPSNDPTTQYRIAFEVLNTLDEALEYTFKITSIDIGATYNVNQTLAILTGYEGFGTDLSFQSNNLSVQESKLPPAANYYNEAVVDIYLKKTGSFGGTPYDVIITSSVFDPLTNVGGFSGSIYPGVVIDFEQSPILDIENPQDFVPGNIATTSSTQNELGDMYYVEYSMSNFVGGVLNNITQTNQNITFQTDSDLSRIEITQSYSTPPGAGIFNATGSIVLRQGNTANTSNLGTEVTTLSWNLDPEADGTEAYRVNLSGSFTGKYIHNDVFRFSVRNAKTSLGLQSGLHIENITASLFPSQSIWSPLTSSSDLNVFRSPEDVSLIIPSYYPGVLPFDLATDCQPLLNNFVNQRTNPYLMDIDYNFQGNTIYFSSSLAPVNFKQILSGSAIRAAVPVSNYTQFSSISPRYLGAKSTSQRLNVWSVGDTGTFGKNPTVELRDAYFGYFNDLDDPYPNINNLTRVNLNYLIDEQGNALPPSLNQLSIDTFQTVFPNETLGKLAVKSGENQYRSLGKPAVIERMMQYVTPIMYSQNSGDNYTNIIPLSGSGYISRYDNDDASAQTFSGFNALGEAIGFVIQPTQSIDLILNPTSSVTSASGTTFSPWDLGNTTAGAGVAYYDEDKYSSLTIGEDLPNQQIITLQSSIVTSFISDTKRVRDELQFNLHLYTGSNVPQDITSKYNPETEVGFNLEDITCTVYTDDGRITDIGSVLEYGWFNMTNIVNYEKVLNRTSFLGWRRNKWKYSRVPVPTGGISCTVDWEMFETLFDLGLMRERFPRGGAGVKALEWNITANSGNYNIKVGDELRWRFNGSFKDKRSGYRQGFFFPSNFEGQYTSVNIEGVGVYDHLLSEANTAQAPYWVFTGSSGGGTTIVDQRFLVMSSSNMNEAYGSSFRQADLDYFPASSDFFPMGVEPKNTRFDNIEYSLELQIGDEIRFANNENFTYTIKEVFPPQNNNGTFDRKNRLKIKVDQPVDTSINKDFFLVRRPIVNPNSLYLNTPFPYESLSSASISNGVVEYSGSRFALTGSINTGSVNGNANLSGSYSASFSDLEITSTPGILYPDFPTEYLIQSASIIVNDLISKRIIES